MAEARPHEPKLRALSAYEAGELRVAARARVDRHLAACALCRAALEGQRRYDLLLADARAAAAPELAWPRMELALQRAVVDARRGARLRTVAAVAALAVAACLALVLGEVLRAPRPQPRVRVRPAPARIAVPEVAPQLAIRVSAIVGRADAIDAAGAQHVVGMATALQEGWTVRTGPASELHLVLDGSAAILLAADSRLRLGRTRRGDVVLALELGRVINAVRPLAPGGRYHVEALGHEIAVRGTHFSVEEHASGLAVQVDEGWVSVLRDGMLVTELRAPQRWTQAGATAEAGAGAPGRLPRPREPAPGFERWPVLEVPAWPRVVGWEIDSARLGGAGELAMRVPPGGLDIVALLQNGRRMRSHVYIDALGARFDPRGLELEGAVSTPRAAQSSGAVDPAQAAAVIRAAQPELQRCYERSLRNRPAGSLAARLRLQIDGQGRVLSAELGTLAEEPPPVMLSECIRAAAVRWRFPPPGGKGIAFEAPIRFQARN